MVRGRRKIAAASIDGTSTQNKSYRKNNEKFVGKLSHASPSSSPKIPEYFQHAIASRSNQFTIKLEDVSKQLFEKNTRPEDEIGTRETERDISDAQKNTASEVHLKPKTQECVQLSPSTALSELNLNGVKKPAKFKKRLTPLVEIIDNMKIMKSKSPDGKQSTLTDFFVVRRSARKTTQTVIEERENSIKEAILSNKDTGLAVRIFEGKGRGIIALRRFIKGEFVVEYAGELISSEVAKKREGIYAQDQNTGCYMYYFKYKNEQYCVDATAETDRLGRLLNHSRSGNLCPKTIEVNGEPHIVLLAKETILPGTECTYDYGDRSKESLMYHPWYPFNRDKSGRHDPWSKVTDRNSVWPPGPKN